MRITLQSLTLAAVASVLLLSSRVEAAPVFDQTGSYSISGTNFPDNFSDAGLALDGTLKNINGGELTIQEVFSPDPVDPNSEWIEFVISKTTGAPLAGNTAALWRFDINDIPYLQPSSFTGFFFSFTTGGVPDTTINNFGGLTVITNPVTGAGNVFGSLFPGNLSVFPELDGVFAFINPYFFLASGGVDFNLIDGLIVGVRGTSRATPVPEPTSMALFGLTAAGLLVVQRRRRGRQHVEESAIA